MKVIYEFDEDDTHRIKVFQKAQDFYQALLDLDGTLDGLCENGRPFCRNCAEYVDSCLNIIKESGVQDI